MRSALALVVIIVAGLFISAQVRVSQDYDVHGWAGPHPSQLVSYHVNVEGGTTSGAWGSPVTIVPTVPGNGLVITRIVSQSTVNGGDKKFLRIMANTIEQRFLGMLDGPYLLQTDLGSGLVIKKGVPLALQMLNTNQPRGKLAVTITGYIW